MARARQASSRGAAMVGAGFCGAKGQTSSRSSSPENNSRGNITVDVTTSPCGVDVIQVRQTHDSPAHRRRNSGATVRPPPVERCERPLTPRLSGASPVTPATTYGSGTPDSWREESWQEVTTPPMSPMAPQTFSSLPESPPPTLASERFVSDIPRDLEEAPIRLATSPDHGASAARQLFADLASTPEHTPELVGLGATTDTLPVLARPPVVGRPRPAYGASVPHSPSPPRSPMRERSQSVSGIPSGPGSWLAHRLDTESTANDWAIAIALANQLAEEDREQAVLAASPSRQRRASDPGHRPNMAMNVMTARDEALAMALALAEEEAATGVNRPHPAPARRRLRPGGIILPPVQFPMANVDGSLTSTRENMEDAEKCIACEDAVVNCCLIPCGHVLLCIPCARKVNPARCPVCRVPFQQVVRTTSRKRNI